jgi:hypothetical protein
MKTIISRYSLSLLTIVGLSIYVVVNLAWLERHFKSEELASYLSALIIIILSSSFFVCKKETRIKYLWAIITPEIASILAYTVLTLFYAMLHKAPLKIAFIDWLIVAIVMPTVAHLKGEDDALAIPTCRRFTYLGQPILLLHPRRE